MVRIRLSRDLVFTALDSLVGALVEIFGGKGIIAIDRSCFTRNPETEGGIWLLGYHLTAAVKFWFCDSPSDDSRFAKEVLEREILVIVVESGPTVQSGTVSLVLGNSFLVHGVCKSPRGATRMQRRTWDARLRTDL